MIDIMKWIAENEYEVAIRDRYGDTHLTETVVDSEELRNALHELLAENEQLKRFSEQTCFKLNLEHQTVEELRAETRDLRKSSQVPGVMHCAKCGFQQTRTNLYINSGSVGPGDNATEPCPNDCGPLWPVAWEQYAGQLSEDIKHLHDKLAKYISGECTCPLHVWNPQSAPEKPAQHFPGCPRIAADEIERLRAIPSDIDIGMEL